MGLRFHALGQDVRFQPDEAWFSTFARAAAVNGDWWLPGPLDKPPLAIYANALAQVLVGDSEFAARLPGVFASVLLMPVMVAAARAWYRPTDHQDSSLPIIVLTLTALSPFLLAFSATAYTDGLMLLGMALALALAGRHRWGWSGLWLGVAFASKPQGMFYLPLLLALGWFVGELRPRQAIRFVVAFAAASLLLLLWDFARPDTGIFTLAALHNDPGRLIRANEVWPRLRAWLAEAQLLLGPAWITLLMTGLSLVGLFLRVAREPRQRNSLIDVTLFNFVLAFGLLHWLAALNTFDRYLLPLLPPLILLTGRGIEEITGLFSLQRAVFIRRAMAAVLLIALLPAAIDASEGRSGINTVHRQYVGIDQLVVYLNAQPVAMVIYDHWLGWELGYYLGQWHDKRIVYYPTPDTLVQGALALCEIGPRYFPTPADEPVGPWLDALKTAGFDVTPTYVSSHFLVYRLIPPWISVDDCL